MFDSAPPEYYGNDSEMGESGKRLLKEERKAEEAGAFFAFALLIPSLSLPLRRKRC